VVSRDRIIAANQSREPCPVQQRRRAHSGTARILDPYAIFAAIGEVPYDWWIDSDALAWGPNVHGVLGPLDPAALTSGKSYAQLIDPQSGSSRFDAVMRSGRRDEGAGIPYLVQYALRASAAAQEAIWIDETLSPLEPRNIYGVTKRAAEELCRLFNHLHRLPILILRTSRFFPEEDDMAHAIAQSGENTKANEFLFRRLAVDDVAEAHVVALAKAKDIGFDTFIISAMTPFSRSDCRELIVDAPSVVARYFPDYLDKYQRRGWTMFGSIERVYDASKAKRKLGFACRTGFREILDGLR